MVVITATNHAELLDRAVWRRFQLRLTLPAPTLAQRTQWFERFQSRLDVTLDIEPKTLAAGLKVTSFSDLEQFCEDVHRRYVLALPSGDIKTIIAERIAQWKLRASIGDAPGR